VEHYQQTHWQVSIRQSNGCSTPATKSSAAKHWLEELAQKGEVVIFCHVHEVMNE